MLNFFHKLYDIILHIYFMSKEMAAMRLSHFAEWRKCNFYRLQARDNLFILIYIELRQIIKQLLQRKTKYLCEYNTLMIEVAGFVLTDLT